jgi:hypothetical protein
MSAKMSNKIHSRSGISIRELRSGPGLSHNLSGVVVKDDESEKDQRNFAWWCGWGAHINFFLDLFII